jgi:predicted enzyme related to lactoylglutathione lyase
MTLAQRLGLAVVLAALPSSGAAQVRTGHVAWHDLITPSLEVSKAFYSGLLGWTWRAPTGGKGVDYVVGELQGVGMAGLAESDGKGSSAQWVTYFSVDDLHRTVKVATDSGAKVVVKPTTTGSWHDESALLTDPQGAAFALMKPGARPNDTVTAMLNGWLWVELWTVNAEDAGVFYAWLLGYEQDRVKVGGQDYTLLERDSVPVAGVLTIPVKGVRPNWLPTIRVADLRATLAKAVALGGRVIMAPREDVRNSTVAIIADPTGAALALQQWDGTTRVGAR